MAVSRGSCRGRVLWHPHMPRPMLAMPSHATSCTPIPPWSSSKCRNTPSINQLHVFAFQVGRSVWLNKDYYLNTSSSSKIFRQGGNDWNLFDFDTNQQHFFCVDTCTIKYYSIPSVPSRLEGVKTRPVSGLLLGASFLFQPPIGRTRSWRFQYFDKNKKRSSVKFVKLSINNHIVSLVHKHHIMNET